MQNLGGQTECIVDNWKIVNEKTNQNESNPDYFWQSFENYSKLTLLFNETTLQARYFFIRTTVVIFIITLKG